jgi:Raf kinase inhibitor-like YbhB/YbcL family protein
MHHLRRAALFFGLLITIFAVGLIIKETTQKKRLTMDNAPTSNSFSLVSEVFADKQPIPALYTCKGQNIRPPLSINQVPSGTKSLAIIMRDPDAVNGEWTHWIIWNISPSTTTIDERAFLAGAVEGVTSFGKPGYGGPCPPAGSGAHHYIFDLYALNSVVNLPPTADRAQLEKAMSGHNIAKTSLTGTYKT